MRQGTERERLERRLLGRMARTSLRYGVIAPGDRILAAISGGKDSYCLVHLLDALRQRLPFPIELTAVHVNQCRPGYDGAPLARWLEERALPYRIVVDDTYAVEQRHAVEGGAACALCARLRRGILYTWAERLGCNKVALGHHRDDTIATLLMNLFHGGKIQAMPPRYHTDDGRFEVIRPLIEIAERDLERLALLAGFPRAPCSRCGTQPDHARHAVQALLADLERKHPHVRDVLLAALKNVHPSHLMDPALRRGGSPEDGPARPAHEPR